MNRTRIELGWRTSAAILGLIFVSSATVAQPTETCSAGTDTGPINLPFNGTFTPTADDFDLTSCLAPAGTRPDSVVCIRPTTDCMVDFFCSTNGTAGIFVAWRVGACTTADTSCPGTGTSPGLSMQINNLPLVGDQTNCFICSSVDSALHTVSIELSDISPTGCGLLPVELMSFEVGG